MLNPSHTDESTNSLAILRDRSQKGIDEHIHKEIFYIFFLLFTFLMLPFYMYVNEQRGMGTKKKEKLVYSSSSLRKKYIYKQRF